MTTTAPRPLPRSARWGYGGGEWANAVVWTAFTSLFLYFFTDTIHMSAAIAGFIVMVGTLWNTVLQPVVGIVSDRSKLPGGRRRPFLIYSLVPFALTSWLLFTDIGLEGAEATIYFGVIVVAWFTTLTVFYVPYGALGAELSIDYDERTRLSTVRTAWSQLGALVGATLPLLLLEPLSQLLGSRTGGWSAASAVLAALASIGILVTWRTSKGHVVTSEPAAAGFFEMFGVLRSRTFRLLMGAYVCGWAPLSLIGAVAIYYAVHIMGYSESQASLVMLIWFAAGLAWLPLVQFVSRRLGKVRTYLLFTITWALAQLLFLLPSRGDDVLFWVVLLLSSAGSMAVAVIGWSLLADVTDVEELRSGQRREGALYGLAALAQTGLAAILVWLVGVALSASGYQGTEAPGASALLMIRLLMAAGTGVCLLPGILFAQRIRLTRDRHAAIRAALDSGEVDSARQAELLRGL